jgi:hypothetical protein
MSVVSVDETDIPLIPDAMRATNDVVDDVGVNVVEALHGMGALSLSRCKVGVVMTFYLES